MKRSKLFLPALLLLTWLTIPLLGTKPFKKYLNAAIFICTLTSAIDLFGEKKKWWRFYKGIGSLNRMNYFNFGPYFVTSLWILKMTYRKFPLYLITNTILHVCFIYLGGLKFLRRFQVLSLVNLSKIQYLAIDFLRALLLYSFQYIDDLCHKKTKNNSNKNDEAGALLNDT